MTGVWHDGALSTLIPANSCVAWSVALEGAAATAALAGTPALPDDLIDAARVRHGGSRLVRRRLVRALVARMAECAVDTVRIGRSDWGAPIVIAPLGWHVGMSGRHGHALIAAAPYPVAVDREPVDEDAAIAWDMLSATEADALRALPPPRQAADWLRRWTIKEAHAKLIGQPRRIQPEAVETVLIDPVAATATFEGIAGCVTRWTTDAVETLASWHLIAHGIS